MTEKKDMMLGAFDIAQNTCPTDFGNGFQCFLANISAEMAKPHFDDNVLEAFNRACTGCDVTSVLLDSPALRPFLTLRTESSIRDEGAADALREHGNAHFKHGRFEEAIEAYNNSLLQCRREVSADRGVSECLALSYGNRSAVLYQIGELQRCLADIDAAIDAGYPTKAVHKLHERKVRCFLRLGNYSAAAKAVTAARESLSAATITENERQVVSKLLDGHALTCASAKKTDSAGSLAESCNGNAYPSAPPLLHGPNDKYAAFSAAVDVVENERYGKHVICKQKIEVGDVVAAEEPLVAVPLATSLTTHCYFCLQRYGAAFYPCRRCSVALYCSQECESRSWSSYHRYECYKMLALTGCGHHLGHLSLRATLIAGLTHYFSHSRAGMASADRASAEPLCCSQCSPSYNSVLRQGIPKEAYSLPNLVSLSILAVYLALCTHPDVVELIPSCEKSEKTFLHHVAATTFTHLAAFINRSHYIYETEIGSLRCDATRSASAIYPLVNLFNHSCNASVYRTYHGNKVVMRSVCTMQPGDQVFDCYGAYYMGMDRLERRSYLKSYYFECACIACEGNWPTKAVLARQAEADPLPSCVHKSAWSAGKRRCPSCLGKLSSLASKLIRVAILPDSGRDKVLVKTLTKILADLHSIALQPHFMFVDCREKLTFCFDLMGNSHRVVTSDAFSDLMAIAQAFST